eukprot:gene7727-7926_t
MVAGTFFLCRLVEDFKMLFNSTTAGQTGGSAAVAAASAALPADAAAPFSILTTIGASLPGLDPNGTGGDMGGEGGAKDYNSSNSAVRGLVVSGISEEQAAVLQQRSAAVQSIFADAATEIPVQAFSAERQLCASPASLSKGLAPSGRVTKLFLQRDCINPSTRLIWLGRRCGRLLDKTNANVFGSCGVPPTLPLYLPTVACRTLQPPPPSLPFALPRSSVADGENVPQNLYQIEAVASDVLVDAESLQGSLSEKQQVVVGVLDSGVDSGHPDIRYAGGQNFRNDGGDPGLDLSGHGTFVAGIIGAMNTGVGVVGVSAGMPIFSLQVLGDNNFGFTSWLIAALNWILINGAQNNIKVINLSLGINRTPSQGDRDFQDLKQVICGLAQALSDAGVVVVVAAGNEATDLSLRLPSCCPSVLAVTALQDDGVTPARFSNWLPAAAPAAERAHVIAAPGQTIFSTMSRSKVIAGYATMSGTSFAAPHAAAVAANCIIAQQCTSQMTGLEKFAKIQAAALQRMQLATSNIVWSWRPVDMTNVELDRYYGLKLWSKF